MCSQPKAQLHAAEAPTFQDWAFASVTNFAIELTLNSSCTLRSALRDVGVFPLYASLDAPSKMLEMLN